MEEKIGPMSKRKGKAKVIKVEVRLIRNRY